MKKLFTTLIIISGMMFALQASADSFSTDPAVLPQPARQTIADNFSKTGIGLIKTETHLIGRDDYEVRFTDGSEIEFDSNGAWTSVDCGKNAVPKNFVPARIREYVKKNLRGVAIVKIERERHGYEIELADGVDVKFDLEGNFKSIDMN